MSPRETVLPTRHRQRHAMHSAGEHAIAPNQTITRGMPLDRIGERYDPVRRRFGLPIYARHPDPRRNGAGPDSIAASDVITGDEPGVAMVIEDGMFPIDELVLPDGMTVRDGQNVGCVRVIDQYQPEP